MRACVFPLILLFFLSFSETNAQVDTIPKTDSIIQIELPLYLSTPAFLDCHHGHICCQVFCRCCPRTRFSWVQELNFDNRLRIKANLSSSYPVSEGKAKKFELKAEEDTANRRRVIIRISEDWSFASLMMNSQKLDLINRKTGKTILSNADEVYYQNGHYYVNINDKLGILDSNLNWKIKPYKLASSRLWNKSQIMLTDNDKYGLIDSIGGILLTMEYDEIKPIVKGQYLLKKEGLESIVNEDFQTVIPFKYKEIYQIYYLNTQHYLVKNHKDKFGIIDSTDKFKIQPEFETISPIRENRGYAVEKDGKWGFFSPDFKQVIQTDYDSMDIKNCVYVQKDGLWGFYELDGTKLSDCIYQLSSQSNYGFYHLRIGNKWGLISPYSPYLIPAEYQLISGIFPDHANKKTYFVIKKDKKYGLLEARSNTEVAPIEYDEVRTKKSFHGKTSNISKEDIYLRKGDKWALFKGEGIPLEFNIDNISEEINRKYEFRYGIRTSIVFD